MSEGDFEIQQSRSESEILTTTPNQFFFKIHVINSKPNVNIGTKISANRRQSYCHQFPLAALDSHFSTQADNRDLLYPGSNISGRARSCNGKWRQEFSIMLTELPRTFILNSTSTIENEIQLCLVESPAQNPQYIWLKLAFLT